MEEGTSEKDQRDIKRLISQRKKRPAFARMISWEFSNAAKKQECGKTSSTKRKQKVVNQTEPAEHGTDDVTGRHERLSTIGSVGSTSSDDSEYYSAAEDENELEVVCTALDDVVINDDAFDGIVPDNERLGPDDGEVPSVACLHPGRRRRPSKKQKRKKTKEYKILFADNLHVLDNFLDIFWDIDEACVEVNEHQDVFSVQRSIPSLVQLCMAATQKVDKDDYNQLPLAMKRSVVSWRIGERNLQKQLTWLQNQLLPKAICVQDSGCFTYMYWRNVSKSDNQLKQYHDVFVFPTRSVWEALPWPMVSSWNEGRLNYQSGKAASFLLSVDFKSLDYTQLNVNLAHDYDEFIHENAVTCCVYLSALASCVDLMLPAAVTNRATGPSTTSDTEILTPGLTTVIARVKSALKSRFSLLVDELFDKALPYVMWARGNAPLATTLFRKLIQDEKRSRYKAMYLSEIGRMNAMFGDSELAATFYKLATEAGLEKNKYQSADIDEATEQLQILKAHAHDAGVMTTEKALQSGQYWCGALNLPKQRLPTALAAVETFLCYHAAHWKGRRWTEEGLARIKLCEVDHPYVEYIGAMLLAMDGKGVESRRMYGNCRARMMYNNSIPWQTMATRPCAGVEIRRNPWQPLVAIATNQKFPIMPLNVVWRTQLTTPSLSQVRQWEADITSDRVNLRLNADGNVTGDVQMVLPPIRDVALDPYNGSYVVSHVPSFTNTWKSSVFPLLNYIMFSELFLPTQHLIYSDGDGTTVYLEKTSTEAAEARHRKKESTLPLVLYWQSGGQRARLDIIKVFKTKMKKTEEEKVKKKVGIAETMRQEMLDMIPVCYRMNRSMCLEDLQVSYNRKSGSESSAKKGQKSKKKVAKKGKYWYLPTEVLSLSQTGEAVVYGNTIWIPLECHKNKQWALFINVKDRESFLEVRLQEQCRVAPCAEELPSFQLDSSDAEFLLLQTVADRTMINIHNQGGECIQVLSRMCKDSTTVPQCCPCIIGSYFFSIAMGKISVWKHLIGLEDEDKGEETDRLREANSSWALTPYWSLVDGSEACEIKSMNVIGKLVQGCGKLLVLYTTVGLSFMDPNTMKLMPIGIKTEDGTCPLPLNDDNNIVVGKFVTLEVLAEKHYSEDGKNISLIAVAIEFHILVFELQTFGFSEDSGPQLNIITSIALPGIPKEACFIGKVGFLVSVSQHTDTEQFHREHLFHFNFDGHLYGVLPCLGHGPRSFLPVYLHGNSDKAEGQGQAGWYVYMRDGHGGIMGVKLHGKGL